MTGSLGAQAPGGPTEAMNIELAEGLKLNLGCRDRDIPGFRGMDMDAHPGVDYVGDVADLSRFADASVEAIYASHILEHFPHVKTLSVLKEWARVLRPGGILYVAVPDFERAVELYRACGGLNDWVLNYLWGDQVYGSAFHYAGFDFAKLEHLLQEAGFSEASQVENFPVGHPNDCSRNLSTWDHKPVSLNVVAVR